MKRHIKSGYASISSTICHASEGLSFDGCRRELSLRLNRTLCRIVRTILCLPFCACLFLQKSLGEEFNSPVGMASELINTSSNLPIPISAIIATQRLEMTTAFRTRNISIPPEFNNFFCLVKSNDWQQADKIYKEIMRQKQENLESIWKIKGLSEPIYVTYWTHYWFSRWPCTQIVAYAQEMLAGLSDKSILFTSTDAGLIFGAAYKCVIGQKYPIIIAINRLADPDYRNYIHEMYPELCFPHEKVVWDMAKDILPITSSNKEHVIVSTNWEQILQLSILILKKIFDANKDQYQFFVDEGYTVPWMYAYLEPHGLLLKLNNHQLQKLEDDSIKNDSQYWNVLFKTKILHAKQHGGAAVSAYAKKRTAIGGLYAYRKLYEEAENAYHQAIDISPDFPEPYFRLAKIYDEQGKKEEACKILQLCRQRNPGCDTPTK